MPAAADMRSAGLVTVIGAALYALPVAVWVRYSEEIVSAGGLAAFVEAAVGWRLALVQAAIWAFSYFLYLPYTVTDIVYEMLADIFPGIEPWRWLIELILPLTIVGLVLLGTRPVLQLLLVSAALQLALMLALGFVMLAKSGAPTHSFTHSPGSHGLLRGGANIALLFLCGSLPIFLGAEVIGGSRTVRRTLVGAGTIVAAYLIFTMFPLAAVDPALRQADLPGYAIASAYSSRWFAVTIGVGAAASVAGVILAEYLALSRLSVLGDRDPHPQAPRVDRSAVRRSRRAEHCRPGVVRRERPATVPDRALSLPADRLRRLPDLPPSPGQADTRRRAPRRRRVRPDGMGPLPGDQ